jgi:calcineurin-like phosphoesterase family protein
MIFFISDTHFFHKNIIRFCDRPFASVEAMNEAMIENWNAAVGVCDTVWHLGDFSFGTHEMQLSIIERLNGEIHIVQGNHDRSLNFLLDIGFKTAQKAKTLFLDGLHVHLAHKPYTPQFGYVDDLHLCGHVHEKWKVRDGVINMSVDQWGFKPVSLSEVIEYADSIGVYEPLEADIDETLCHS